MSSQHLDDSSFRLQSMMMNHCNLLVVKTWSDLIYRVSNNNISITFGRK